MTVVYLITGANSKIGSELVAKIQDKGYLYLLSDVAKISSEYFYEGDICNHDFVSNLYDKALTLGNEVRLVNLAGVTHPQKGVYPIVEWEKTFNVNATGAFILMREFHSRVLKQEIKLGTIVNISSAVAGKVLTDNPAYTASKLVVESLTRHYASALAIYGISVNCIAPGYINSGMTSASYQDLQLRKKRSDLSFLKRWGEASEVADLIWYLSQKGNSFISGSVVYIDGGWSSNSGL